MARSAGMLDVTPTFPTVDMDAAQRFYEAAGFDVHRYDDGFAFVSDGEASLCDLDLAASMDPARNDAGCYVIVPDVDAWHARFTATGSAVTPIAHQPWGMREFSVRDPSGNNLRIGRSA